MSLKDYERLGWKYEYCAAIPAYLLINPSGKLVWTDHSFTSTENHVVKMIIHRKKLFTTTHEILHSPKPLFKQSNAI